MRETKNAYRIWWETSTLNTEKMEGKMKMGFRERLCFGVGGVEPSGSATTV
jgi:hypothetical protein